MKKKKFLSLLLVLTLIFSMTASLQTAFAASPVKISQMTAGTVVNFAGKTWTILNPTSGYMLCNEFIENRVFDSDNTSTFNPSDSNNIGYYLNNNFYSSLTAADSALIQPKSWSIENTANQVLSSVNGKVGILSNQEAASYSQYFRNISSTNWFWTRTWHSADSVRVVNKDGTPDNKLANSSGIQVLPAIYLSPDALVLGGTVLGGVQHGVSLSAFPAAGGTVTGEGAYISGQQVTVTATVNDGYTFTNWTKNGTEASKNLTYSFVQDSNNVSLVANFVGIPHTVVVSSANTNYGTVSGGGSSFIVGDTVTVTAVPNSGYCLDNWTENGTIVSVGNSYTFVQGMTDRSLVANFKPIPAGFGTLSDLSVGDIVNFGGKEWILLNKQTGYMILNGNLGNREYDDEGGLWYHPTRPQNIAYYLNNDFLNTLYAGDRGLVQEHTWGIGVADGPEGISIAGEDAKTVSCKVGLLSCNEWRVYKGGNPLPFEKFVWLITPDTEGRVYTTYDNGYDYTPTTWDKKLVRPTIYLLPSTLIKNNTVAGGHFKTPVITDISPAAGPESGGGKVTISGAGFNGATSVKFGTAEGTGMVVNGDSSLIVTPPAGSGTVDVIVTGPMGTSAVNGNTRYTYNQPQVVTLTANPASGGTVGGGGLKYEGDSVTATATPSAGYQFLNWSDENTIVSTDAAFSFTMGAIAVSLTANFELIPYSISIEQSTHGTVTASAVTAAAGSIIKLTVQPESGYRLKMLLLKRNDGTPDAVIKETGFSMPAANVTISAEFEYVPPTTYAVSVGTLTGGSITVLPSTTAAGATVQLTITPDTGKRLKAGTLKYNDGTTDSAISGTSFMMPAANVTVTAEFENVPVSTYTVSIGTLTGGSITAVPTTTAAGATVQLTITPDTGKRLKADTLKYNDGTTDSAISGTSFTMPAVNVTVSAEFENIPASVSDADKVAADKAALNIGYAVGDNAASVTQNLSLTVTGAVYGSTITWSSSNATVISNSGAVTRPAYASGNANVTVTASVYSNGVGSTKDFSLIVLKLAQPTYTVTFKDWDGSTLKSESVKEGSGSTAPSNLSRAGYIFTGWDKAFSSVTSNLTVTAQYSQNPAATLQSIAITKPASKLTYTVGDSLDISGLEVTGTYSDGSTKAETITVVNVTGFSSSVPAASQLLTVTVGGKTAAYNIVINAAPTYSITSISDQTMTALSSGYASGTQETKTITVTKTGTGNIANLAVALCGTNAWSFTISSPIVTALNLGTPSTTFTVKAKDGLAAGTYTTTVTISATNMSNVTFTVTQVVNSAPPTPGNNGSGSGGSSNGGGSVTPATDTSKTETVVSGNTATAAITTKATVDGSGKATASVTQTQVNDIVSKAVEEASKQGNGTSAVAEIIVEAAADAKTVEVGLPRTAVDAVAKSNVDALTVSTPIAAITFDSKALDTIAGAAAADVKISASKVDTGTLSQEIKQAVGDRPVYNFSVTSGSNTISQFGGNVSVAVPYTLKPGEDNNAVVIYYINAEGKLETVSNCHYDPATGKVTFTTNHFSKYAVGYNKVSFKDVAADAWYSKAVGFIAARGITTGTGSGNYSPQAKLTRGEFLVMMMRAYGIKPDESPKDNFADAGSTYYTGYMAAAKRLGISGGVGNNRFAPDKEITRQEMFTLLYNTLKTISSLPQGNSRKTLAGFSDAEQIDSWAKDAMTLLVETGIVGGNAGSLNPAGTTTRAEMAQVLYNLLSK